MQLEKMLARRDASGRKVISAEAPGPNAKPSEVLVRVPQVRQLPVEDAPQSVVADHKVADAKVAMHQRDSLQRRRVQPKPAQTELERRVPLAAGIEIAFQPRH